ncbi:MAG TPA: ABC transporter substrate-binding protein, partial [Candidatus Eisenbacteria bacterium]|nr:ABC transporter substrate-binding protein [Candidatus Eisenbacteria bacterium]
MRRDFAIAIVASVLVCAAEAKPFRWASQGDPQTIDPHSQNELLTNSVNGQMYETLVNRGKKLEIVPVLATEWQQVDPLTWRFALRQGVKFHDGTPFTADDVLFSVQRASQPSSQIRVYAQALGKPRKIDDHTVEFKLEEPNPVLLEHATLVQMMSKAWCVKNRVEKPLDFSAREESYASTHANGTGPYLLKSREPDVKTVLVRNPNWWGKPEGNVTEVIYTSIKSDATRVSALIAGNIDLILDPPPQDVPRLKKQAGIRVIEGTENRIIFFGFDQSRDQLLYSDVKGKNPFKDRRVREAIYRAIDIEALRRVTMRGQAAPTGGITPSILASNPEVEKRLPHDPALAKKLLAEAGYPNGFGFTLDCPNNRYINDEQICVAVSGMLAKIGLKVRVNAQPRAIYFARMPKRDTSAYMLGWGGAITDAETTFTPVLHSPDAKGRGDWNWGSYQNKKLDELIDAQRVESDPAKRKKLIAEALAEHNAQIHHVPLHRQVIPWAMR